MFSCAKPHSLRSFNRCEEFQDKVYAQQLFRIRFKLSGFHFADTKVLFPDYLEKWRGCWFRKVCEDLANDTVFSFCICVVESAAFEVQTSLSSTLSLNVAFTVQESAIIHDAKARFRTSAGADLRQFLT